MLRKGLMFSRIRKMEWFSGTQALETPTDGVWRFGVLSLFWIRILFPFGQIIGVSPLNSANFKILEVQITEFIRATKPLGVENATSSEVTD